MGNHINKAYFEEKYVRDILQTEPDPVLFHLFLMESEADRVIHLFDGETWDKIHQKWDEGGFLPDMKIIMRMATGKCLIILWQTEMCPAFFGKRKRRFEDISIIFTAIMWFLIILKSDLRGMLWGNFKKLKL